jgi:hypothetical protein
VTGTGALGARVGTAIVVDFAARRFFRYSLAQLRHFGLRPSGALDFAVKSRTSFSVWQVMHVLFIGFSFVGLAVR